MEAMMTGMSGALKKRATYADVQNVPPDKVAEVLRGELFVFPRPAGPHCATASGLGQLLAPFDRGAGGPGGWRILDEPELHFGAGESVDILVPDLAGWRRDRMPSPPAAAFITTTPDWVCEVLSASTAAIDRSEKLPIYAREGVGHTWLVDPLVESIEAYVLEGTRWVLDAVHRGTDVARLAPFAELDLDLRRLFHG